MNNTSFEPNLGYQNSGYYADEDTLGYASPEKVHQGNFDDGYQENVYDSSNLADSAWTDSPTRSNTQFELELD